MRIHAKEGIGALNLSSVLILLVELGDGISGIDPGSKPVRTITAIVNISLMRKKGTSHGTAFAS
jgi:hypothetical protein